LFYEVGEDYVTKRAAFREAHLEKAWKVSERGELLLGGAFANPVDGAVLPFQGNSSKVAEKFAEADSYVTSGNGQAVVCPGMDDDRRKGRCCARQAEDCANDKRQPLSSRSIEKRSFQLAREHDLANVASAINYRKS
jgi:uncharacterized protein YciI